MSETLFDILWTTAWQFALLAVAVWTVIFLLGERLQPRFRYILWCVVLLRLFVPITPMVSWGIFSNHEISRQQEPENNFVALNFDAEILMTPFHFESVTEFQPTQDFPQTEPVSHSVTLKDLTPFWKPGVLLLWGIGVVFFALRYIFDELQLYRESRKWSRVEDAAMLHLLQQCCGEVGVRRHVNFFVVPQEIGAASSGFWRSSVLISETSLDTITPVQLRLILLHELVHIKRFDPMVLRISSLLGVIYWFHPLLWFVLSRLQRDREPACDAAVLHILNKHKTVTEIRANQKNYGRTVLLFAESTSSHRCLPGLVGASLDYRYKNNIARRIDMILKYKRNTILQSILGLTLVTLFIAFGLTRAAEKIPEIPPQNNETKIAAKNDTTNIDTANEVFIQGRVTDPAGKPVENALVLWKTTEKQQLENRKKAVKTDSQGRYHSPGLLPVKEGSITVIAEGFAPQLRELEFRTNMPPVDFSLKRGKKLEINIVDVDGKAIPGVEVTLGGTGIISGRTVPGSGWRMNANIYNDKTEGIPETHIPNKTDENGVYRWDWAPDDAVLFSFYKTGYLYRLVDPMLVGQNWMTAREEPYKVILYKKKFIQGKVVDETTGKPIEKFRVITGTVDYHQENVHWNPRDSSHITITKNTFQWDNNYENKWYQFRVEAAGYHSFVSHKFGPDRDLIYDIGLKPDPGLSFTVLSPDGKPLDGVKVFRTIEEEYFQCYQTFKDTELRTDRKPVTETDEQGHFTVLSSDANFLLFLRHSEGTAWVEKKDLPQDHVIRLQAGVQVRIAANRDKSQKLSQGIALQLKDSPLGYASYQYPIPENDEVVIDNVMPGNYSLFQRYDYPGQEDAFATRGFVAVYVPVKIEPNQTNSLDMNFSGQTISGTVTMPESVTRFRAVKDWEYPEIRLSTVNEKDRLPSMLTTLIVPSKEDPNIGEFTFKNVPNGGYRLHAEVRKSPETGKTLAPSVFAQYGTQIKVEDSAQKLNIVLTLKMQGDIVFQNGIWTCTTTGEILKPGAEISTANGIFLLNTKDGLGTVDRLEYDGTIISAKYIRLSDDGGSAQLEP